MATQATAKYLEAKEKRQQQAYLILDHLRRAAEEQRPMSKEAIAAAKIFLSKTLPDLKAVEHSGDAANPVAIAAVQRVIHDPAHDTNT